MKFLAHELMSTGQVIPDEELVLYILGGLGFEYESVIVNLSSKNSVTLLEAHFMLQPHELCLEQFNSSTGLEVSHATAHLSLKNHSSAPDRPLLDSHYPSWGHYTPGYRGRNPRGRSYFPCQGSYGSPLKSLCQICGRAGHSALKCFHRFDLLYSNPQTTAGVPANTSTMEPFRQVPQSFDPLHSSSQALVTTPSLPPDDAWYLTVELHTTLHPMSLPLTLRLLIMAPTNSLSAMAQLYLLNT